MVVNSSTEDVASCVQRVTASKGAYAAYDAIGGLASQMLLAAVRDEGTLVVYGVLSGMTMTTGQSVPKQACWSSN